MEFSAKSVLRLIVAPAAAAASVAALVLGVATLANPANAAEPKQGNVGDQSLKAEFTAPKSEGALNKYATCTEAQAAFAKSMKTVGAANGEAVVTTTAGKTCKLSVK